jgi:protein O-mannosyl-transferase
MGTPAALAVVALVATACYLNSLGNRFAFDDLEVVVRNPLVVGGQPGRVSAAFTSHYWAHVRETGSLYRPVTILSYAANHAISGLSPWSYHAANILLHALVSCLVWTLGSRLGLGAPGATAAALVFAAHPVHTEAVAGIVGRAELLAAAGVLGAWVVHLGGAGAARAAGTGLLFALGLFSKENAIVLPAFLVLGDLWRGRREPRSPARPRASIASYAACALVVALWGGMRSSALPPEPPDLSDSPLAGVAAGTRALTALHVLARDAWLLIWPRTLSADYSFDQIPLVRSAADPLAIAGAVLLGLTAWAALGVRRGRTGGLLAACGIVSILPVSNLVIPIGTLMAERLLYLPSVFFCLALPLAWSHVARRAERGASTRRAVVPAVVVVLMVIAGGARTLARNADWRDQLTLFETTVRTSPRCARAHYNFGVALEDAGRPAEALAQYGEAIAIDAEDRRSHHNAGLLLAASNRLEEAAAHLETALRLDPSMKDAAASLGAVYAGLGRGPDAERVLRAALPGAQGEVRHRLLYNLGTLFLEQGRGAEALPLLEEARATAPDDADGRYQLGLAYMGAGRWSDARGEMRRARELSPSLAEASLHEAMASLRLGDRSGAAQAAARARAAGLELPEELRALSP